MSKYIWAAKLELVGEEKKRTQSCMGKINGGSGRRARGEYDPNEVSKTLKELANGAKLGEGRVDR